MAELPAGRGDWPGPAGPAGPADPVTDTEPTGYRWPAPDYDNWHTGPIGRTDRLRSWDDGTGQRWDHAGDDLGDLAGLDGYPGDYRDEPTGHEGHRGQHPGGRARRGPRSDPPGDIWRVGPRA